MADEAEWGRIAAALGFQVVEPIGEYTHHDSWEHVTRARRAGSGTGNRWLVGRTRVAAIQRDVEVVVLQDSHISGHHNTKHVHTHVLARVDPPMHLGLDLRLWRPLGETPTVITGDPHFDSTYFLNAAVRGAAARLFHRTVAPPNDLVDHVGAIAGLGQVHVCDSYVNVQLGREIELHTLKAAITSATTLAAFVAYRRTTIPPDPEEQQRIAAWKAFADAEHLSFDDKHFVIAGAGFRIGLESELDRFYTTLTVQPPSPLGLGLHVSKESAAVQFIGGIFGSQDIKIGDEFFDAAFAIKGTNEYAVRAFLGANPMGRSALLELSRWSKDLTFDDAGLFTRAERVADGPLLHWLVQLAGGVATLFRTRP